MSEKYGSSKRKHEKQNPGKWFSEIKNVMK